MRASRAAFPCLLMTLAAGVALAAGAALPAGAPPPEPEKPLTARQIAESESPTVVLIETEGKGRSLQGSGVIVGAAGLIVTNLHVLDGATSVTVSLPDSRRSAEIAVLAFDVEGDLVVLQADFPEGSPGLPEADLGKSGSVKPGDAIVVISNPLGLALSVMEGIVSAWREPREDRIDRDLDARETILPLPTRRLLQISAAISPGSSGGPVFNDRGEVIGIATAGLLYGMADLNFAVPIDDLPEMIRQRAPMDLPTFHDRVARVRLQLARPLYETALVAWEQGDSRRAIRHLSRALLHYPAYESALVLAGRIRMDEAELDQAERLFARAVEANEESAEAWYRLGTLYDVKAADSGSLSTLERAETAYRRSLDLDPGHAQAAFALALLDVRRGDLEEAEELLRAAAASDTGLIDAQVILGLILLERGEAEDAEETFRQALWQNADHPLANFGLAQTFMTQSDNRRRAGAYWEKFLRLSRDVPSLRREREIALRIVARHFPEITGR